MGLKPAETTGALAKGKARFAAILEHSLDPNSAAERLGVSPSRIRQKMSERQLYSFVIDGRRRLPAFQFLQDRLVPNIEAVNQALPEKLHAVAIERWYKTPTAELEAHGEPLSPLDWLELGRDPEAVVAWAGEFDTFG